MKVKKHDGRIEDFDSSKVLNAVKKASDAVGHSGEGLANEVAISVKNIVANEECFHDVHQIDVEEIHDAVEEVLMCLAPDVAKAYIIYRQKRTEARERDSELNKEIALYYTTVNKDNANAANGSAASKMYSVAEAATKRYNLAHMSQKYAENHKAGRCYIHDLGYYGVAFNCFYNPLGLMLEHGFNNGVGRVRPPKRIGSAVALACIILQSSQNSMFGGQGYLCFDSDLAQYVTREFEYQKEQIFLAMEQQGVVCDKKIAREQAMERTEKAVYQAMEQFVYNCNMMRSRSGAQVTFSSVNFGIDTSWQGRMISRNLLKAYIAGLGHGENPIFPNLCYKVKKGINLKEGEPNFDITQLAIECVGKRIQPRFVFCDSSAYAGMPLEYVGTMGCRTAVRSNINGDKNPDARGNLAFITMNLPMFALEAKEEAQKTGEDEMDVFWRIYDEAINDCIGELLERYSVLCGLKVRDIPFVADWYQGHEGLTEDDSIEPMIKNGSLSVGFCGLAECLVALTGKHHGEDLNVQSLGLDIVARIRHATDRAAEKYHLNFSTFATPAESTAWTFLKACRKRFGVIEGVTDKEYLTNSSHLPVGFECDAKTKIDIEAPYHLLCNAGHIFYVEVGRTPKWNPEGVLDLIRYMNDSGIVFGGINWEHDFCMDCGYQGTFEGDCPKCGGHDIKVTKIVTGYLSETFRFNPGKKAEAADRISHLGGALGDC